MYLLALDKLIEKFQNLNIVVIGANDGKLNDPIYPFVKKNLAQTKILLIEPNAAALPYLRDNYQFHPHHEIANLAISKDHPLSLYVIKKEYWDYFQPAYAKDWPRYRAPTGITSATRSHLLKHLSLGHLSAEEVIQKIEVESKELISLLVEMSWPFPIDVLQIDAEGDDDSVIYASNLEYTRPKLIFFEYCHIQQARMTLLNRYLSRVRYQIYPEGPNILAIDRDLKW